MTRLDPHFEDHAGDLSDCPACSGGDPCVVCGGEGRVVAHDLPAFEHPFTLKHRDGDFA